jgi:hypothetical protein
LPGRTNPSHGIGLGFAEGQVNTTFTTAESTMAKKPITKEQSVPVSAQTAGGIAGAALGGVVAGPIGAIAGGLAGALVGDSSAKGNKPIKQAVEAVQSVGRRGAKALSSVKKKVKATPTKKSGKATGTKKREVSSGPAGTPGKKKAARTSTSSAKGGSKAVGRRGRYWLIAAFASVFLLVIVPPDAGLACSPAFSWGSSEA